jgi:adenylate cyclase
VGQGAGGDVSAGFLDRHHPDAGDVSPLERKQVTVVSADIVEPACYFQALELRDAVNLLDTVLTSMRSVVSQFHGTVTRIDHDGMMVLFGPVTAHQDGALRACYAAAAMQQAVRHVAEESYGRHAVVPQVRLGLASGEVVLRAVNAALSTDYTASGLPLHIASRIARLSHPSSIWLSAETMRMVEGRVQVRVRDASTAARADQSMMAYELVDTRTAAGLCRSSEAPALAHTI